MRAAELLNHFIMHYFRVEGFPSTFLTGAAVDKIISTGGWKTESTAYYKIGANSNAQVGSKDKCGQG